MIFGATLNIVGYYAFGSLVQGNWVACIAEIPFNAVQEAAGAIVFTFLALSLDLTKGVKHAISRHLGIESKGKSQQK